ncbi:hypothetical protein, partial [Acinetobacter baumannii]|uniref:hypothetical protein n=1 Tax=Acinetobacter baumannii TaxID=470 RepID=UPI001C09501E
PIDSLLVSQQVSGPGWCDNGKGQPFFITGGMLMAGHSDHAFTSTPSTASRFQFRTIKIPLNSAQSFARFAQHLP